MSVKSGSTTISAFTYDGLGHRITETPVAEVLSGNATDIYYSSQWQVLQENQTISGNLSVQARYVWSPVYVNAMILRDYGVDVDGNFSIVTERTYVTQDANYNVTTLLGYDDSTLIGDINMDLHVDNADQDILLAHWQDSVTPNTNGDLNGDGVVNIEDLQIMANNWEDWDGFKAYEHFSYSAYGLQTTYNSSWSTTSDTLDWNYGFQGGRLDKATGLINFEERDYNPRTYTWNTQDPLGFVNGADRNQLEESDPINELDPSGEVSVYFAGFDEDFGTLAKTRGASMAGHAAAAAAAFGWVDKVFAYTDLDAGVKYLEKHHCGSVVIIGYSLGGLTAIQAAEKLKADHIQVDLLATLDPVTNIGDNVRFNSTWKTELAASASPVIAAGWDAAKLQASLSGPWNPSYKLDKSNIKEAWNWYEDVGEKAPAPGYAVGSEIIGAVNYFDYRGRYSYGPAGSIIVAPHITQHREFQWDVDISNRIRLEARRIQGNSEYMPPPVPSDIA